MFYSFRAGAESVCCSNKYEEREREREIVIIILTVSASIADPPARSRHPPTLPPTDDTNIDTETRPGQGQRVLSSPTEAQVGVEVGSW